MARRQKLKMTKTAIAARRRYRRGKAKASRRVKKKTRKRQHVIHRTRLTKGDRELMKGPPWSRVKKPKRRGCGKRKWASGDGAYWKCKPGVKKRVYKS